MDLTTQLVWPYFINNKTSISAAASLMFDKQSTYYIPSISFRVGTQSQTATYTRLFVDWNLQLSDPQTVTTLKDTSIGTEWTKQFNSLLWLRCSGTSAMISSIPHQGYINLSQLKKADCFRGHLMDHLG